MAIACGQLTSMALLEDGEVVQILLLIFSLFDFLHNLFYKALRLGL